MNITNKSVRVSKIGHVSVGDCFVPAGFGSEVFIVIGTGDVGVKCVGLSDGAVVELLAADKVIEVECFVSFKYRPPLEDWEVINEEA